ncbi:MAG: LLM class flavin-dependent oxidoreductase [Chloroflexia bacterium]|nr:LLM class flavin-dependent oxidoreductase [Chloroflexia bacterium]
MTATASRRVRVGLAMPPKPPFGTLRQALVLCRLLRFDSFLVWDHLQDLVSRSLWQPETTWAAKAGESPHQFFDFQTTLGALAARAGRVRLGVAVTEPARRHPVMIAQAMLTLAHLSSRPPILGLGAGERGNTEPYGLSVETGVSRLEEALQVIRLCFNGESSLEFDGNFFHLERAHFDLKAPPDRTPRIWIGGSGPRMLRLTGAYGDGWYPTGALMPGEYHAKLGLIHDAARLAGRDPSRITPAFQPVIVAAPTEQAARQLLDHPMIRYLGLLLPAVAWEERGHRHPFGPAYRGYHDLLPERYTAAETHAAIAAVPLELAEAGLIWGTPRQIIGRLHDYVNAGLRYIVPQLPALMVSRRAALYNIRLLHTIAAEFRRPV